ncbi:acyl-CoA dehydrogenase family protein [Mycobacterium branderi]|uniref:Acyl-CoA dehydrogenase n=1 Tax=Mycobacterium branderi TaxID=43348 RepID=A0A7I7WEU3_9MYCO|nr:acyl-CoA dehydrogenase family protein [Mycobacterium branderi]MCV7231777.1 acyl-CoA dehydrogenase family protein [Mycobacterium branderi]ORA40263.1 acyl-CoA dehydrogenase [Mycobacterium branderi]BBZ15570.1 acyl-CoA dehydrogenase [Mycobacterium branderi]
MTALSTDEKTELAESVRRACARLASEQRVRTVAFEHHGKQRGFDTELWDVLCRQVGVTAIALPERLGGTDSDTMALGVVAHELGRVLAPVPFVASTVLATGLLVEAGVPAERLEPLIDGERTAAAAITGTGGRWDRSDIALTAARTGSRWTIDGTARHVLHGGAADDLVVVAIADGQPAVFLLDAAERGITVQAERVLDATRPMATITCTRAPAEQLVAGEPVDDLIDHCMQRALAVLSAEQVGACERVLELATEYARTREQFGRPIGSFQAIKHRCADMLVDLELARSASLAALQSIDDGDDESGWRVSMAKAVCSESLRAAAHANVQIHGGIGFTWEHAAGLYLKRARTDEVLFGRPDEHWDRLAGDARLL